MPVMGYIHGIKIFYLVYGTGSNGGWVKLVLDDFLNIKLTYLSKKEINNLQLRKK